MKNLFLLSLIAISLNTFSAEPKTKEAPATTYPALEDVRCEKLTGHNLVEFKQKLVETCDLNKPFSSSMSKLLNEETYFYCCQLRK